MAAAEAAPSSARRGDPSEEEELVASTRDRRVRARAFRRHRGQDHRDGAALRPRLGRESPLEKGREAQRRHG